MGPVGYSNIAKGVVFFFIKTDLPYVGLSQAYHPYSNRRENVLLHKIIV